MSELTPKKIQCNYRRILAKIQKANDELMALRALCPHENVKKVNRGSSGNYDPSCDGYWRECTCLDCGRFWTEDQ
jgi:nitrite reductase/ring-hydroxylating ferredoxin subunit